MKRSNQIEDALGKLKEDVSWKAERQESNRIELMAKMTNAKLSSREEARKSRLLPITAFVFMLAIFGALLFQLIGDKNDVTEGKKPDVIDKEDVKPNKDENNNQTNGTTEEQPSLADQYEKEKSMEIELEGTKEPVSMVLATNEDLRYVIYIEKDSYEFRQDEDFDTITFPGIDVSYPEVAMEIRKSQYPTLEEAIREVSEETEAEKMRVENSEEVTWPITATAFYAYDPENPHDWNSPVHKYYVTEQAGEIFIIKQKYFVTAEEGHGARFDYMLTTFEVIPE